MSSDGKFFIGVIIVAILALGGFIFYSGGKKNDTANIDYTIGQKFGSDSAKIKIVEFGDFQCPACASAADAFEGLKKEKDVQISFRHFPLTNIHANAEISSYAAEAAANQNKFWEMYNLLYERQTVWSASQAPKDIFIGYAQELKLDVEKFKKDIDSDAVKKIVQRDYNAAIELGANSTPTFFINNKKITGALTVAQWQKELEEARAK
ncbi:DsbA family protein [Candidatus Berkelbacteria bacterium]|nr:DsbA family protein [Candidatus Berkelbacteria bacterium]